MFLETKVNDRRFDLRVGDVMGHLLAPIFFFILFPSMFAYHLLAAVGLIPLFLGGWWGIMLAVTSMAMVPLLVINMKKNGIYRHQYVILILFAWISCYALYFFVLGDDFQRSTSALFQSIMLIAGWSALYCIGFFFNTGEIWRRTLLASWLMMSAVAIVGMDAGSLSFIPTIRFNAPFVADYQWFATSYVFVSLVLLALCTKFVQATIVVFTSLVLFLLSSRSEFAGFMAVVIVWTAIAIRDGLWKPALIAMFSVFFVIYSLVFWPEVISEQIRSMQQSIKVELAVPGIKQEGSVGTKNTEAAAENFRQAEMKSITQSQSFSERALYFQRGVADIASSPIFGVYAGQMRDGSPFGTYIHNGMELWRQFGLLPFILFVGFNIYVCFDITRMTYRERHRETYSAFYVVFFTTGLIVATKAIFWPMIALGWGMWANRKRSQLQSAVHRERSVASET